MILDINGDGIKDVLKCTTLSTALNISALANPPASVGYWTTSNVIYSASPFNFDCGDLNSDGRFDLERLTQ
jgi:hypothetical protein